MTVVAEGVESQGVAEQLLEYGCDYAQGYHLGRPQAASDIEANWLIRRKKQELSESAPESTDPCHSHSVQVLSGCLPRCASCSAAPGAHARRKTPSIDASQPALDVVVVSARKRSEPEISVPAAITTFTAEALDNFGIRSFTDYAAMTPNLSFSYGGGPTGIASARTVAIRGIAGQNLVGTAGATSLYIDDTPVPVSVDPRVLDIHDIEVLKVLRARCMARAPWVAASGWLPISRNWPVIHLSFRETPVAPLAAVRILVPAPLQTSSSFRMSSDCALWFLVITTPAT